MGLYMIAAAFPKQVVYCPGVNPFKLDNAGWTSWNGLCCSRRRSGSKFTSGIIRFYAYDSVYQPAYRYEGLAVNK
ncbi:hypothetical protein J22TS1_16940 [Siminovitchia terrae]|nr:hypothetical protein J22TS1_16940 [Siminovitchia terrae]